MEPMESFPKLFISVQHKFSRITSLLCQSRFDKNNGRPMNPRRSLQFANERFLYKAAWLVLLITPSQTVFVYVAETQSGGGGNGGLPIGALVGGIAAFLALLIMSLIVLKYRGDGDKRVLYSVSRRSRSSTFNSKRQSNVAELAGNPCQNHVEWQKSNGAKIHQLLLRTSLKLTLHFL